MFILSDHLKSREDEPELFDWMEEPPAPINSKEQRQKQGSLTDFVQALCGAPALTASEKKMPLREFVRAKLSTKRTFRQIVNQNKDLWEK